MKIALCCIGRMENRYSKEYVEYYKNIGVDKIFVYDNNYDGEEHFEDVLQEYIDSGFIDIINFRNKNMCQLSAYQDCYDKHKNDFDWFCFFDFDEYLFLENGNNLKTLFFSKIYDEYDMIHVNWMCYGDNNIIKYDESKIIDKFVNPIVPIDFKKTYDFPENCHVKSIVRGGLDIKWSETPHTPIGIDKCCDSLGNSCKSDSPFTKTMIHKNMFLKHYVTKSIQEWYEIKSKRGYPDGNKEFFKTHDIFDEFFKWNNKTDEKMKYIESLGDYKSRDIKDILDIFICTHKNFKPLVSNPIYKIINSSNIDNDTWNGLNGSFYSEIMSYFYIAENYPLKDYVGFCHYRKYWAFMDKIPDIEYLISKYGVIGASQITVKQTIKKHYALCHNVEDLYIISGILAEKYPSYIGVWNDFLSGNKLFPYNMFIMKREEFLEYIKFMKNILDEFVNIIGKNVEKRIYDNYEKYMKNFSPNNEVWYQYRIGGYLAERLTNVWLLKNHDKIGVCGVKITSSKYGIKKESEQLFH